MLNQNFKRLAGECLIATANFIPAARPCFKKWGLRTSKEWFGDRVVRVQVPGTHGFQLASVSQNYLSFELFWRGAGYYEPITTLVARELIGPGATFIDVGANIGFYALVLSTLRPGVRVVAFEPNPKNYHLLVQNAAVNRFEQIRCERLALSDSEQNAVLYLSASDMSASLESDFDAHPTESLRVATTTLDQYLAEHPETGKPLIKVDVEGHEAAFFRGAHRSIAALKPDIICEVTCDYGDEVTAFLEGEGYRFYQITNRGLLEAKQLGPVIHGPFVFLNYLLSTRPVEEIADLYKRIQSAVRAIDLTETSKFVGTAMIQKLRERQSSPNRTPTFETQLHAR